MAINLQQKEVVVAALKRDLSASRASFLVGIQGLTVENMQSLRKQLRSQSGSMRVAKVRLMQRAVKEYDGMQSLNEFLNKQIAIVFANNDVSVIAKLLCDFSKENELLRIVAGYMDAAILDNRSVYVIASLPSRQVLLGQLVGTLQAPLTGLVMTLNQMMVKLVVVLQRIEEQKKNI